MVRHTVSFSLVHAPDSAEEREFLSAGRELLSSIPGVEHFTIARQVGPKSGYQFQFAMTFASDEAYAAYNDHPDHARFVSTRWSDEVAEFAELDFIAYP